MFEKIEKLKIGFTETDLKPTEDVKKVIKMIEKIFPESALEVEENKVIGKADLSEFKKIIEKEKIRATIGEVFDQNESSGRSFIDLSKLAALAGKVAVDEDFSLGKIRLYVDWEKNKETNK